MLYYCYFEIVLRSVQFLIIGVVTDTDTLAHKYGRNRIRFNIKSVLYILSNILVERERERERERESERERERERERQRERE